MNENLPQRKKQTSVKSIAEENQRLLVLQQYVKKLNDAVDESKLEEHPVVSNVKYLPIGIMQMMMDELFLGLWRTQNFRWERVGNEVVGTEEVSFFHPVAKCWITRIGAGAIQIMVDSFPESKPTEKSLLREWNTRKNQWALNPGNKKPGALSMGGFAALEAYCFKNAVLTIGKKFGRDVNRKFYDKFESWITSFDKKIDKYRKLISDSLSVYQDTDKDEIIQKIHHAEDNDLDTPSFYIGILKQLGYANSDELNESN